jgi:hypothetical protein
MSYKSIIETKGLTSLLGNTSDDKVAELAGLSREAVRTFRIRRRIPARWLGETEVTSTTIPPINAVARSLPVNPAAAVNGQTPKRYKTSSISAVEDSDGRTTANDGDAQNIVTVYTPSATARLRTKARVTLSIQHGEDSVLTLKGKAVHTLFRVLSAHYGRPLPRNGWDE